MNQEYEIIKNPNLKYLNIFIVEISYRNPHVHQEIELDLVLNGDVMVKTQQISTCFNKNNLFFFNANQPHEFRSLRGNAQILCIQISPKFSSKYYATLNNTVFDVFDIKDHVDKDKYKFIQNLMVEIAYIYYKKCVGYEFSVFSLINLLFNLFINKLPYHTITDKEKILASKKTDRLNKIIDFIEENYQNKISLTDIANNENLSTTYLSHFIKDNLNQNFQDYVNEIRFAKAKSLIENRKMSLTDICMECGFSDYRYLYKAFLKNCGCSPKEYRASINYDGMEDKYVNSQKSEKMYSIEQSLIILEKLHTKMKTSNENYMLRLFEY